MTADESEIQNNNYIPCVKLKTLISSSAEIPIEHTKSCQTPLLHVGCMLLSQDKTYGVLMSTYKLTQYMYP